MTEHDTTDRSLAGEVAVVTGGNGGIGLGMAMGMARAGASVAIWGRNADKNEEALDRLASTGADVAAYVCDVADETQVIDTFAATLDRFGKVDSCFANAGMGGVSPFVDMSFDLWRKVMSVNLDGAFLTLREAARHMVARGEGGSLVVTSSTSAIHGAPANEAYSSSKTAVLGLMRGLAVELARYKIRCNSLLPGWTDTEMAAAGKANEKFLEATTKRTPVRRWADPDEFGPVAVYLARRDITFHTGDQLVVDGGYTVF